MSFFVLAGLAVVMVVGSFIWQLGATVVKFRKRETELLLDLLRYKKAYQELLLCVARTNLEDVQKGLANNPTDGVLALIAEQYENEILVGEERLETFDRAVAPLEKAVAG